MKIGNSIAHIRKEQGMTQEEFASIFSVTRQTISNWEKEKSYPDLQTLVDMSNRFDISLDCMLKEDVDMVKKFDRERKWGNYIKCILLILAVIIAVFSVAWSIVWYHVRKEAETKFQDGVERFGFQDNLSTGDEEFYQYPYKLEYNGEVIFYLGDFMMSGWLDFRYLGSYNQILMCRMQRENDLLQIEWYGKDADMVTMYTYDKEGKHLLSEQAAKKLLRDDKQIKELDDKAQEMCGMLYIDYVWLLR